MLLAVAVASPGTISVEGTYIMQKGPAMSIIRNRTPVILAVFLIEFAFFVVVILFLLFD
jgi:hypothetical protein